MKLIDGGCVVEFIEISAAEIPISFLVKLKDRTYRLTFRYNEHAGFFTVDLFSEIDGNTMPLVYGEILRYGKPLFEAFNDERYPLPVICPLCLSDEETDDISYAEFGSKIKLYVLERT